MDWEGKRSSRKTSGRLFKNVIQTHAVGGGRGEGRQSRNTGDGAGFLYAAPVCMMDIYRQYVLSVIIFSAGLSFAIWWWPLWWWLLCCVQLWLKKVTWGSGIYHMSHKAALWRWVCKADAGFHSITSLSFLSKPQPISSFFCVQYPCSHEW